MMLVGAALLAGCNRVFGLTDLAVAADATVPIGQFTAIAATQGGHHVCAIDRATRLWCWGANEHRQSGDRPELFSGTPTLAFTSPELADRWTQIAAGVTHTCGIQRDDVVCWGNNAAKQVGIASSGVDEPLTRLVLPEPPRSIHAGGATSCAITLSGALYCWGVTEPALPASSTVLAQMTPAGFVDGWSSVAITDTHVCAQRADGAFCWGKNDVKQLDAVADSATSSMAIGVSFTGVATGGANGCGLDAERHLVCWGAALDGLLGPTITAPATDVVIDALRPWSAIAIADHHVCAISEGDVFCFGEDTSGALGDGFVGHAAIAATPTLTDAATDVTQIVGGDDFTCALDSGGHIACWGSNVHGELGNGEVAYKRDPVTVRLPAGEVRAISTGTRHTCALVDSSVYCWGDNTQGQIDPALARSQLVDPTRLDLGFAVDAISAGGGHTCARDAATSSLHCWGDNTHGQLGIAGGSRGTIAAPPSALWGAFSAGTSGTCAATRMPSTIVQCWGRVDATTETPTPVRITTTDEPVWNGVSVGDEFSVGIRAVAHDIAIWGPDCSGQPGTHTLPTMSTKSLFAAVSVARAGGHVCAASTATIICWGANQASQTGLAGGCIEGTNLMPVTAPAPLTWNGPTISVAGNHSCALAVTGALYCWGDVSEVALDGGVTAIPTRVTTPVWAAVSTAPAHTCAIEIDAASVASVACWGANRFGEVGDGTRHRDRPTAILAPAS